MHQTARSAATRRHIALAKQAALESMVLLKNDKGTLPISPTVKKVAVLGAKVPYTVDHGGRRHPVPSTSPPTCAPATSDRAAPSPTPRSRPVPSPALQATGGTVPGPLAAVDRSTSPRRRTTGGTSARSRAPRDADFVVVVAGLTPQDEGEEYTAARRRSNASRARACARRQAAERDVPGTSRTSSSPTVAALGKPMVVVLEGGSVIDMPWLAQVPAVVMAWYPGQRGGEALGDLLWGAGERRLLQLRRQAAVHLGQAAQRLRHRSTARSGTTTFDYYVGYRYFDYNKIRRRFSRSEPGSATRRSSTATCSSGAAT